MDTQRFALGPDITSKVVDGEVIIINLANGTYYSLQATGAVVWALAEAGRDAAQIAQDLSARFDAGDRDVDADVAALLEELVAEKLLAPDEGVSPGQPSDELAEGGPYAPPVLEKYTDMSDLLALDPPMPGIREVPWQASGDDR